MANILGNLNRAIILGLVLLAIVIFGFHGQSLGSTWANWLLRATHAWVGLLWIGLLYYFNFVQIPTMPKVPAELKPGVTKYIAPEALFWFRWAALFTVVLGLGIPSLSRLPHRERAGSCRRLSGDRHRHVAGHHHVRQRLDVHLAGPEDCARHC